MDTGVVKEIPTSKVICVAPAESKKCCSTNFVPGPSDVIIGRGKKSFQHQGNIKLRHIVASMMGEYSAAATKSDKSKIISTVVSHVQWSSPNGGRFVKQDPNVEGMWLDVDEAIAREKVSQVFRDALHHKYKSSNEFKKRNRRVVQCNNLITGKPICTHPQTKNSKKEPANSDWENNDDVMHSLHLLVGSSGVFYERRKQLFLALPSSLPESSQLTQWFEDDQSF